MANEFDWEGLKKTNQRTIDTVFGYIRAVYGDVPPLIQYSCLAFYRSSDQWDRDCMGDDYVLSEDNLTITHTAKEHSYSSAFCKAVISKGTYYWRFLIKQRKQSGGNWAIIIGI